MTHTNASAYLPGVQNINHREAMYRRRIGYVGLVVFVVFLVVFLFFAKLMWWRTLLFIPASVSIMGFLEARYHFCVMYASKGVQNATENSRRPTTITSEQALQKDRRRVRLMMVQAGLAALGVTLLSLLLPSRAGR